PAVPPPESSEQPDAKAHIESLVAEAERLVAVARQEAERIVSSAREETKRKVEQLVAQAEELRRTAEAEAAEMLREAEEARRAAREEADALLAQARATHEIVQRANQIPPRTASTGGNGPEAADARAEADRILRVARAEAEA